MASHSSSRLVVYAALLGNLMIAISKFVATAISGSSAMLSEGVHSLVDTTNQVLLLYGMRRSEKAPDPTHPFGYGREIYFWSFIVALLVLALGAGVSLFEGIMHLRNPEPMVEPLINYAVLAVSALFEGISWTIALKSFRASKGDLGYFAMFRRSKDPTTFTVLLEDSAALLGILIAFAGIGLAQWTGDPRFDGAASIGIGIVLTTSAILLARETKELLIGEPAHPAVREAILRIANDDPGVRHANGVLTVQMGPSQVVATLSAEFEDELTTPEVEECVNRIEQAARRGHPEITALFIKPQTAEQWQRKQRDDQPM